MIVIIDKFDTSTLSKNVKVHATGNISLDANLAEFNQLMDWARAWLWNETLIPFVGPEKLSSIEYSACGLLKEWLDTGAKLEKSL